MHEIFFSVDIIDAWTALAVKWSVNYSPHSILLCLGPEAVPVCVFLKISWLYSHCHTLFTISSCTASEL